MSTFSSNGANRRGFQPNLTFNIVYKCNLFKELIDVDHILKQNQVCLSVAGRVQGP